MVLEVMNAKDTGGDIIQEFTEKVRPKKLGIIDDLFLSCLYPNRNSNVSFNSSRGTYFCSIANISNNVAIFHSRFDFQSRLY